MSEENKKNKLRDIIKTKIMTLIKPAKGMMVDSVRVNIASNIKYLEEIYTGKITNLSNEYKMLRMDKEELGNCQIIISSGKLVYKNNPKKIASTIGLSSKLQKNLQAFVMGKDGALYMATHIGKFVPNTSVANLSHASFLGGKPAELAGLISISDEGKIIEITNNSGHYLPEALDMYRGIKKLGKDVFAPNAVVVIGNKKENIVDFIEHMESIQENSKALHENLREDRVEAIRHEIRAKSSLKAGMENYADFLKNDDSDRSVVEDVEYDVFSANPVVVLGKEEEVKYDIFDSNSSYNTQQDYDKENIDFNKKLQQATKEELDKLSKISPMDNKENKPKKDTNKIVRAGSTPSSPNKGQVLKYR